jgi:hypothetical protein
VVHVVHVGVRHCGLWCSRCTEGVAPRPAFDVVAVVAWPELQQPLPLGCTVHGAVKGLQGALAVLVD